MAAQRTAAAPVKSDGRKETNDRAPCTPSSPPDQQQRVLAVLRAAYRSACEAQDEIAEDIVLLIGLARAIESGSCDPAVGLARAVELDLIALGEDVP